MTPVFNAEDMKKIKSTYENVKKTLEERAFMYENDAIDYFTKVVIDNKNTIMNHLQDTIRNNSNSASFKVNIACFYSMDWTNETRGDSLSQPLYGDSEHGFVNMYHIWKYTNFATRIMHRLGLNTAQYTLVLDSNVEDTYKDKNIYYNMMVLIYTP